MKLRNKLIATIVSISMVLAVIGVGAWASTESFTATITNTVNLEFDNIKGQIAVEAMFGADDVSDGTLLQNVLYDGSNVIYNQISSAATSGTNLYWEGTQFLDGSDDGLGLVDASTEAAAILYAFMYQPTEDCVGTSTITAMVNEANAPEISGGKLMVKYFATTDLETLTEIASGEAITPINDNEFLVIMAVCQFYNLDGESISTTASAWDFSVTFSAGSNELTTLPGGAIIDDPDPSDGVVLPFDYKSGRGTPRIRNTANLEFQNLDGQVFVEGMSGADNVSSDQTPHLQEELYTENQAVYTQISPDATSGTNLNWNGTRFLDGSTGGPGLVNDSTKSAVFGYAFVYQPADDCTGEKTITITLEETSRPEISGGQLTVKYYLSMTGVGVMDLYSGEPQTRFKDNMPIYVIAICQYYNLDGAEVTTIESDWDFSVKFSAGTEVYLMPWSLQSLDLSGVQEGVVLPLEKVEEKPWEIIEFGEYPQSLKADNVSIVSQTPDADGYYLGDDGERYAKHTINLDSNELFWGEVPLYTLDGVLMENGETYYFKVEPIKWRVLKTENGESLIVADEILKGMQYLADESSHNGAPEGTHPNNYVYSDLRAFLTGEFYDVAFSDDEKTKIQTTLVDNSAETLLYEDFACDNTEDKVFALSYADTINEEYFFSTNSTGHVPDRFWRPSDYAVATGTFVNSGETIIGATFPYLIGSGDVWLRSPWGSDSQVSFVSGSSSDDGLYAEYYGGVAPAMRITR